MLWSKNIPDPEIRASCTYLRSRSKRFYARICPRSIQSTASLPLVRIEYIIPSFWALFTPRVGQAEGRVT